VQVCDVHYSPLFSTVGGVSRGVSGSILPPQSVGVLVVVLFVDVVFKFSTEPFHKVIPKILQKDF
jgi:hypothetical protein